MKFEPLTWLSSPTTLRRTLTRLVVVCLLVYAVYKIGYWNGESDGSSTTQHQFGLNIRAAAERERKIVKDTIYAGKLPSSLKPGKYNYEIRSHGGAGTSKFDQVESSVVEISQDRHGYSMTRTSPALTQRISIDGKFFSWEDNESDDGYAENHHVGRIDHGVVTGRIYYIHFKDTGIKHFKLSPVTTPPKNKILPLSALAPWRECTH